MPPPQPLVLQWCKHKPSVILGGVCHSACPGRSWTLFWSIMYPNNLQFTSLLLFYSIGQQFFTFVTSQHDLRSQRGPPMRIPHIDLYSLASPTHHRFSELSQPLRSTLVPPLDLLRQPPPVAFFPPATTVELLHPLHPLLGDARPHLCRRVERIARHAPHLKESLPLFGGGVETYRG